MIDREEDKAKRKYEFVEHDDILPMDLRYELGRREEFARQISESK